MAKALAAADLRTATEEELDLKLTEAKIELFNLRFQAATAATDEAAEGTEAEETSE